MRFSCLALLLSCVLAACQPVPRPFEHDRAAAPNELLKLSDAHGIMVLPVEEAPQVTADALADELVEALKKRNVPAFRTGGNHASSILSGHVVDPGHDARIEWVLYDAEGEILGRHDQIIEGTPIRPWAEADPELMTSLAAAVAEPVAGWVRGDVVEQVTIPAIYVGDVSGGNERQATRLRTALYQALRGMGTRTAIAPSDQTLTATAELALTSLAEARTEVAIVWRVLDPYGTEIGKIDQASPVSDTMIDQQWSTLARQAGVAAAAGISELVGHVDWSAGFVKPDGERADE